MNRCSMMEVQLSFFIPSTHCLSKRHLVSLYQLSEFLHLLFALQPLSVIPRFSHAPYCDGHHYNLSVPLCIVNCSYNISHDKSISSHSFSDKTSLVLSSTCIWWIRIGPSCWQNYSVLVAERLQRRLGRDNNNTCINVPNILHWRVCIPSFWSFISCNVGNRTQCKEDKHQSSARNILGEVWKGISVHQYIHGVLLYFLNFVSYTFWH